MAAGGLGTMASLPPPPSLRLKQSVTLCSCNFSIQIAQVIRERLLVDIQTLPIRARVHWGPRHGFGCMRNRNLPAARSVGASLSSDSSKSPEATENSHSQEVHNAYHNWLRFELSRTLDFFLLFSIRWSPRICSSRASQRD